MINSPAKIKLKNNHFKSVIGIVINVGSWTAVVLQLRKHMRLDAVLEHTVDNEKTTIVILQFTPNAYTK